MCADEGMSQVGNNVPSHRVLGTDLTIRAEQSSPGSSRVAVLVKVAHVSQHFRHQLRHFKGIDWRPADLF